MSQKIARISMNIDESILHAFDELWKSEGWESRQEAIVFLLKQSIARGYISKEKSDLAKALSIHGGEKDGGKPP
jgi:metal-responsive CopG/Arc/MetJ family transcriptional regulator